MITLSLEQRIARLEAIAKLSNTKAEDNLADIDYLAMMTDNEIPRDDDSGENMEDGGDDE
jgi:hypothetical protein